MRLNALTGRTILAGTVLLVGVGVGSVGVPPVHAMSQRVAPPATPAYSVNSNGETYGPALHAISLATEPDLITAVGQGGVSGYVRATDLFGTMPKTPQQAVAMDKEAKTARTIPLYASDGKTVIGTFTVGPARGGTVVLAPPSSRK